MWVRDTPPITNHASGTWILAAAPHPCVPLERGDWLVLAGEGDCYVSVLFCCAVFEAMDDG